MNTDTHPYNEPSYQTFTLDNGLRVIHVPSPTAVAYCGYAIKAGTRFEAPQEQGMAHFVEHLLFKGTEQRKAWHILNRMESVGGDLNAYTNKEEMIIYSAFLSEHFYRAAELLTDIVFHSTFPAHEVAREVEVIIDEIQSYEDTPAELIFDDFEELIYPHHPLGRNILGTPELLRTFRSEDALRFVRQHYRLENMVFFVWADLPTESVRRALERCAPQMTAFPPVPPIEVTPPLYVPAQLTKQKGTSQSYVMLGSKGYGSHEKKRTGLYLLNNLLGGPGMNSRLNVALREKRGLVYNVESNITTYTDTGTFTIAFGCDREDADKCIELVHRELRQLRETPLTPTQLKNAQRQIKGQMGVAADHFENMALEIGKCFLHYGEVDARSQVFQRIDALTAEELQDIAQEVFHPERLSILRYE